MSFKGGLTRGAGWTAPVAILFACSSSSDDLFQDTSGAGSANASSGRSSSSGGSSKAGGSSSAGRSSNLGGAPAGGRSQGGAPPSGAGKGGGSAAISGAGSTGGNRAQGGASGGRGGTAGEAAVRTGGTSGAAGSGGDIGEGGATGAAGEGGQGGEDCVGEGACRRPISCAELHRESPTLPSGRYTLRPLGSLAEFSAYCEMSAEGGGWTLVLNMGPTFNRATVGVPGALCYDASCTNASYSSVLLESDVMLDMNEAPIAGNSYAARAVVSGVDAANRGKTVRTLFNSGPNFIDNDDNSNVVLRLNGTGSCTEQLQDDIESILCSECANDTGCGGAVLVFGDTDSGCVPAGTASFAIGAAMSRSTPWSNCAGWPDAPNLGEQNYYPDYFRVWVR